MGIVIDMGKFVSNRGNGPKEEVAGSATLNTSSNVSNSSKNDIVRGAAYEVARNDAVLDGRKPLMAALTGLKLLSSGLDKVLADI